MELRGALGRLGADEAAAWNTGSSVFFVTLVVCQLGHLLSMRRKDSPYFSDVAGDTLWQKLRNAVASIRFRPTVLLAWAAAMATAVIVTEVPALQYICGTAHVRGSTGGTRSCGPSPASSWLSCASGPSFATPRAASRG